MKFLPEFAAGATLFAVLAAAVGLQDPTAIVEPAAAAPLLALLVGVFVQMAYWQLMPLWYHLAFLVGLVPACVAGAGLRRGRTSPGATP